jgi:hypothetical protein
MPWTQLTRDFSIIILIMFLKKPSKQTSPLVNIYIIYRTIFTNESKGNEIIVNLIHFYGCTMK